MSDLSKEERDAFRKELKELFNIPKDLDSVPVSSANIGALFRAFEGKTFVGTKVVCEGRIAVRTEKAEESSSSSSSSSYVGVQCLRDFRAHEVVAVSPSVYLDRRIDTNVFVFDDHDGKKLVHTAKQDAYSYDWGDKWELCVLPYFTNHSCDPNVYWRSMYDPDDEGCEEGGVGIAPVCVIKAMRDIRAGEFLCFDYNTVFFDALHHFECRCGSASCRGSMKGFDSLAEEEQDKMIETTPYMFDPSWLAEWLAEHLKDHERRKKLMRGLHENDLMPKEHMEIVKENVPNAVEILG